MPEVTRRQSFSLTAGSTLVAALGPISTGVAQEAQPQGGVRATGRGHAVVDTKGRLLAVHEPPAGSSIAPLALAPGASGQEVVLDPGAVGRLLSDLTLFRGSGTPRP